MFYKATTGTVLNINLIESIVPLDKTQVKRLINRLTLAELADMGFKVGRHDEFIETRDYDAAQRAVAESPDTRVISRGVPGYMSLQSGETGLISEFYTPDGVKHKDDLFFLPKSQYNEIMAYIITMRSGDTFYIRIEDYEKIEELLAKC